MTIMAFDPFALPGADKTKTAQKPSGGFTVKKKEPDENPWWKTAQKGAEFLGGPLVPMAKGAYGFAKEAAKPLAKGVAELGLTAAQPFTVAAKTMQTGSLSKGLEEAEKGMDLPYVGKAKPLTSPKRLAGTALTLGSLVPKATFSGAALSGAMYGAGTSMQEDEPLTTAAAKGTTGAIAGLATLGALKGGKGVVEKGVSNTWKDAEARITEQAFAWGHNLKKMDVNAIKNMASDVLGRVKSVKSASVGASGGMETPKFLEAISRERQGVFKEGLGVFEKAKAKIQDTFGKRAETIATRIGPDAKINPQNLRQKLMESVSSKGFGVAQRPAVKGAKIKGKFDVSQKGGLDISGATDDVKSVISRINNIIDQTADTSFQGSMNLKQALGELYEDVEPGAGKAVLDDVFGSLMNEIRGLGKSPATAKQIDLMLNDYKSYLDTKSAFKGFVKEGTNASQESKAFSDFWNTLVKKDPSKIDALRFFEKEAGIKPGTMENKMWGVQMAENIIQEKPLMQPRELSMSKGSMIGRGIEYLSKKVATPERALKTFVDQAEREGMKVTPQYRKFLGNVLANPTLAKSLGLMLTRQATGALDTKPPSMAEGDLSGGETQPLEAMGDEVSFDSVFGEAPSSAVGSPTASPSAPQASGEEIPFDSVFGPSDDWGDTLDEGLYGEPQDGDYLY
jgi:hypothetical protein